MTTDDSNRDERGRADAGARDPFERWKHTELTLDSVPGRGSSFSLDIPTGRRFVISSRVLSEEERAALGEVEAAVEVDGAGVSELPEST